MERRAAARVAARDHPLGVSRADGRAVVSTNFRPYEAVILHLAVQAQRAFPVLWVDHGYNRPATYRHAEELRTLLNLNISAYLPRISAAHRDARLRADSLASMTRRDSSSSAR